MDIEGGYSDNSYSADTGGLGGVNDPFSYYDPATGGYTTGPTYGEYAGDPVRAALYGDVGYGTGMSGDATRVFDNVLNSTGDVGRALSAAWSVENGVGRLGDFIVNPDRTVTDSKNGLTYPEGSVQAKYAWTGDADELVGYELSSRAQPVQSQTEAQYARDQQAIAERQQEEARQAEIQYQEQAQRDLAAAQNAGLGAITTEEVEDLPEDEEAEFQSLLSPTYTQLSPKAQSVYVDALARGLSDDQAFLEALKTQDQELAFEDKIQQLAGEKFEDLPDDSGAGGVDTGDGYFGFNEDRDYGVSLESETAAPPPAPVDDSGAGGVSPEEFEFNEDRDYSYSETAAPPPPQVMASRAFGRRNGFGRTPAPPPPAPAPASVDYDRSLVFGDEGYGEGMTGRQTEVFDRTLNETGDVGEAVRAAADVVTTPSLAFGRRGGFGRTPAPAPPAPAPAPAPPAPAPASATGGLGSVVGRLREGDISGAFSLLRDAVSAPATPTVDEEADTGQSLPSNVVGTGTPGGMLVDERGEPVLSTSYGLPGEYTPSGPTLDPALLELAATARRMTVDELRAVIDAEIQSGSPVGTTGLSQETLEALQSAGFGGRDISPTQTVDQALASMQANEFLTEYMPTLIGMFGPPGAGALLSGVKTINDLMQGKLSPGAALTRELIGAFARQTGLSPTALTNALEGKFGDAAANQVKSSLFNALSQEAGVQGSAIGMIANELGFLNPLTGQIDRAVTEVIPDQNFGIPGRVAAGLDEFVGPIQSTVSQGLGALGDAAQTGLTGLGDFLGQIGQGVQTGVDAVTGGIGDLIDTVTGRGAEEQARLDEIAYQEQVQQDLADAQARQDEIAYQEQVQQDLADAQARQDETGPKGSDVTEDRINTGLDAVDESGVGGFDPDKYEFIEDRIYDTGTDLASGIDADVNAGIGSVVDESGVGGVDDPSQFEFIEDRIYDTGTDLASGIDDMVNAGLTGTGSVGLPGEELGEGILSGVDEWDQALIDADTGGVYDLDTGTDVGDVGDVGGVGDVGDVGDEDTDTVIQPPPVIPPSGGGTTLPYGSYFARVPTGYQVVQGLYGPIMQYTYGNLPLGGA